MDRFTGGCLCGNVRLMAAGLPYRVGFRSFQPVTYDRLNPHSIAAVRDWLQTAKSGRPALVQKETWHYAFATISSHAVGLGNSSFRKPTNAFTFGLPRRLSGHKAVMEERSTANCGNSGFSSLSTVPQSRPCGQRAA